MTKFDCFAHHEAKLIANDDRHLIIDWQDKSGSVLFFVNYIVDKKLGYLHISGDLGEAIAYWAPNLDPIELKSLLKDENYFSSKIRAATMIYKLEGEEKPLSPNVSAWADGYIRAMGELEKEGMIHVSN